MKLSGWIAGAALAVAVALPAPALAEWPDRPVRLIVPFGAGGGADTLARSVGEEMSRTLGQQVVVENVTGAGGVIGVTALANSDPDGYTIGVINVSTTVIAPETNPNVTYDPLQDFEYIALLGGAPTVLAVNSETGIRTLDDLVAAARASERPFTYGTPGALTMSNLVPATYFGDIGVEVEHVPYQGGAAALMDAVAGHISFAALTLAIARPQIEAGTLHGVAISTGQRHPDFPDMPTFAELGHPELTSLTWFGLAAPAGMDPEIVDRLNEEVNRALAAETIRARLEAEGFVIEEMTPAEFRAYQVTQSEIFGPIARQIGN